MLASNTAVRLGLRASSRNAELAFGRALVDQGGTLLSSLPLVLAGLLVWVDNPLRALSVLRWPIVAAIAAALAISFAIGMYFWAGALPLLAADVEMDRRPPPGNFLALGARGFGRAVLVGFLSQLLSWMFAISFLLFSLSAAPLAFAKSSLLLYALIAGGITLGLLLGFLLDLLLRLWLIRATAFGEDSTVAFGKAASLLFQRLGQLVIIALAFLLLETIVGAISGGLGGLISSRGVLDSDAQLLGLAPRIAIGLAFAAIFSWLEVGKMGALAAIACDAEGLLTPAESPPPAETVVEALPVD